MAKAGINKIAVDLLTQKQAAAEHARLSDELKTHSEAYYELDAPKISDAEYDAIKARYQQIEDRFPNLVSLFSETYQVGTKPARGFRKVRHKVLMPSLENAIHEKQIVDFVSKIQDFFMLGAEEEIDFSAEPKIDGLSMSLRYEGGVLKVGATRGDGAEGEDVTANILTLKDVPPQLAAASVPEVCEVRGEVYMTKASFLELNERQKAAEEEVFANPRNSAAGSIRQKDPSITASRPLGFFAYSWGEMSEMPAVTQTEMIEWFKQCGFKTNPLTKRCRSAKQLIDFYHEIEEQRAGLDYDIDGVVYKVDRIDWQTRLGFKSRRPRWGIAHKFDPEKATTRVLGIDIQVGRTGALTPVGRLAPVGVGGVIVQNVTLHNEDYIKGVGGNGEMLREGRDIRIGDTVVVQRAGDVIPQIVDVVADKPRGVESYRFPTKCPCHLRTDVVREVTATGEAGSRARCSGDFECPYQKIERLRHFVSRGAFDIEGFGDEYVQLLFDASLIETPVDIFRLSERVESVRATILEKRKALSKAKIAKTGKEIKKAITDDKRTFRDFDNVLEAIDARRRISLDRFIFALGIRQVGEVTARAIAKHFTDAHSMLLTIESASKERPGSDWIELASINQIGPVARERLINIADGGAADLNLVSGSPSFFRKAGLSAPQRKNLLEHYGTENAIINAARRASRQKPGESYLTLADDSEIGEVSTESLIVFFGEPSNRRLVEGLLREVDVYPIELPNHASPVSGKTIVFTGSLQRMTRDEAKNTAGSLGARVSNSVSSKTDFVVAGPGAGSKLKDAKKYGVKVLSEEDWLRMIAEIRKQ